MKLNNYIINILYYIILCYYIIIIITIIIAILAQAAHQTEWFTAEPSFPQHSIFYLTHSKLYLPHSNVAQEDADQGKEHAQGQGKAQAQEEACGYESQGSGCR